MNYMEREKKSMDEAVLDKLIQSSDRVAKMELLVELTTKAKQQGEREIAFWIITNGRLLVEEA